MNITNISVQAEKIHVLQEALIGQRDDLSLLCSIVEYLKSHKSIGLDHEDTKKYTEKMHSIKLRQTNRYEVIDNVIHETRKDLKDGDTDCHVVVAYGKEVRKLESGLRTLMLFTNDVIEMLKVGSTVEDRVDDRIYYFDKRSSTLETEMSTLQQKMEIS